MSMKGGCEMEGTIGSKTVKGMFWKLLERFGVSGVQFVLQIILARLLDPNHYGVLSIMIIFTTLANVFIQNGFNTALIQNKDVSEEDYSSVFWVSLAISFVLYIGLFFLAPAIAAFYDMPDLIVPFRVLSLMLIPGAFNSVQLAKLSREMDFKKIFYSNVVAIFVSGVTGVMIAFFDGGLWALVAQNLLNVVVASLVMLYTVSWKPRFICNMKRIQVLFSYGWKLLCSSLLDTLYQDLRSLVIGKKYSSDMLGFYNRGKQFPQFVINAVNGAVQSVMLPAMSAQQDDCEKVKSMMRNSITLSAYIIFPMMAGLIAVSSPLVSLLLTDKWLPCVPYMQIYCFTLAFYPVHSCNLQAINAMGRSDIYLKLEIIKKGIGIIALIIAVFCFDSPIAIAMTGVFTTVTSCFINAYPNRKLINYSYLEQLKDLTPSFMSSVIMCLVVLMIGKLKLSIALLLLVQILGGVVVYLLISAILRLKPFVQLKSLLVQFLKK